MADLCPWCKDSPERLIVSAWTLLIPREWPATQEHAGPRLTNGGAARFAYKRIRAAWEGDIKAAAWRAGMRRADRLRRVTLVRLWGKRQRERDMDNLIAGGKPIVDGLRACGVIIGDRRDQALIHYDQRKSADGVSSVLIRIEEFA